jgi:hypothetical protein
MYITLNYLAHILILIVNNYQIDKNVITSKTKPTYKSSARCLICGLPDVLGQSWIHR